MKFRVNAKNFFLTYPQCSLKKEELLLKLKARYSDIIYVLAAEERHESGEPHLHALVSFGQTKNFKASNCFDFDEYHCNIQSAKSLIKCDTYIKKDGNWTEEGSSPLKNPPVKEKRDYYSEMISCNSEEDLFKYCINNRISPSFYYKQAKRFKKDVVTITQNSDGKIHEMFNILEYKNTTWVLTGDSGIGKTSWAINNLPKPILLVTHLDTLKEFNPEYHNSILFDDMDFRHTCYISNPSSRTR